MKPNQQLSICIATGIYPPELGGPAEYAKNLASVWESQGHSVSVKVFSRFNYLPTGLRHCVYFLSLCVSVWKADFVFILDTFSAALPAVVISKIFRKKTILRTGGDFLWEGYVERTGDLVLLKDFYTAHTYPFSRKERVVFRIIQFILKHVDVVVWSTEWQKDIFVGPYDLKSQRSVVIENYYGAKFEYTEAQNKNFVGGTRALKWKNIPMLERVFGAAEVVEKGAHLDLEKVSHDMFIQKIKSSYAVIIPSLGDISPNTILDAIRCGKPFIVTQETGIYERIKPIALFVDPQNEDDIKEKVVWLLDPENYKEQCAKIKAFSFTHTWEDIAQEYIALYKDIQ